MTRTLCLSFDNGPDPECTPEVLDVLGERGVRATFFVCAQGNRLHPAQRAADVAARAILERAAREGHWIGNHTLTHSVELGTSRDRAAVEREIGANQAWLGELAPRRLFRPYMGGGVLSPRTLSPEAVSYLCEGGYTVVLQNCVPRDWERPDTWPELALEQMDALDETLLVVHDVSRYGGMKQLARFLDEAARRGVAFVQDFPADCVPIRDGAVVLPLDGMVCGEEPEPVQPLAAAAAARLHPAPGA